ncbi:MAG: hypothetical protein KGO53_02070 [Alphaproteobacteria bacterium]|nr:hypothetical protein [Alphaproteobacteria bacterium]
MAESGADGKEEKAGLEGPLGICAGGQWPGSGEIQILHLKIVFLYAAPFCLGLRLNN